VIILEIPVSKLGLCTLTVSNIPGLPAVSAAAMLLKSNSIFLTLDRPYEVKWEALRYELQKKEIVFCVCVLIV
jgi:hypothetical protein